MRRRGADCLVIALKPGNARGAKGAGHRHWLGSTGNGRNPMINGRRYSRQAHCTSFTLAEWLCRAADRIDPARVFGPHHCLGQETSASDSEKLCGLLQRRENASVIEQGCACLSPGSAIWRHKFARHTGRTSSSIRSDLDFRYTGIASERRYVIDIRAEPGKIVRGVQRIAAIAPRIQTALGLLEFDH